MASQRSELDAEIQRLYGLPLGDFTKERNALAKRLKKAGRGDDSETVEGLAKPTPSAWAVNMLFERQRDRMDVLLDAGRRARVAQGEAVAGAGAETLRDAIGAARILIEDLRRRAEAILSEDTGKPPSRAVSERIGTNLQSLAFSPSVAEAAQRGWLDDDLEPPGFEVFTGLRIPQRVVDIATRRPGPKPTPEKTPPPAPPGPEPVRPSAKEELEAERRREEAQKRREAAAREREEKAAARLRERLARAEEKVEQAAAEADFHRRKAEQAEKTAADARRRAEAAEEEARQSGERAERADTALERARRELEEARRAVQDGKAASR